MEFEKLTLEKQINVYFDTFGNGEIHLGRSLYAGIIVHKYGIDVLPFLKDRVRNADFVNYITKPKDITLDLIAYILESLNSYSHSEYYEDNEMYIIDDSTIQWFVDQYKNRIDKYIMMAKRIDRIVLISEILIDAITGHNVEKYGHPFFNKAFEERKYDLRIYYEGRLGIRITE
jgi:hypothetical protein